MQIKLETIFSIEKNKLENQSEKNDVFENINYEITIQFLFHEIFKKL